MAAGLLGCSRQDEPPMVSAVAPAAPLPPSEPESAFELTRAMVPMRDGVSLETVIIAPRASPKALPILLQRTPYGVPADARRVLGEWFEALRADGYIYAWQSLRGRFGSEGVFEPE